MSAIPTKQVATTPATFNFTNEQIKEAKFTLNSTATFMGRARSVENAVARFFAVAGVLVLYAAIIPAIVDIVKSASLKDAIKHLEETQEEAPSKKVDNRMKYALAALATITVFASIFAIVSYATSTPAVITPPPTEIESAWTSTKKAASDLWFSTYKLSYACSKSVAYSAGELASSSPSKVSEFVTSSVIPTIAATPTALGSAWNSTKSVAYSAGELASSSASKVSEFVTSSVIPTVAATPTALGSAWNFTKQTAESIGAWLFTSNATLPNVTISNDNLPVFDASVPFVEVLKT